MDEPETTTDETPDDDAIVAQVEDLADGLSDHAQGRLWLDVVARALRQRSPEPDRNYAVQSAIDQMWIAACERVEKLLRAK